jgi:hypothetical protein
VKRIRFGRGEYAGLPRDVEFVGIRSTELGELDWEKYVSKPSKKEPFTWIVRVRGLRPLGPYASLAEAWTTYREMDESDRALLRMEAP